MKYSRRPTDFSYDDWSFYQSENSKENTAFENTSLGKRDNEFDRKHLTSDECNGKSAFIK